MNQREALEHALEALPPVGDKVCEIGPVRKDEEGCFLVPPVTTHPQIERVFSAFRDGQFGIAKDDYAYLPSLDRRGVFESIERDGTDAIARMEEEECLLLLRYFDRQERFCDGARAAAHEQGYLHALLKRLIELKRDPRLRGDDE